MSFPILSRRSAALPSRRNPALHPLVVGLLSLLVPAARADSEEYSAMAHLETTVPVVGGNTQLTVRSPLIGAQVLLGADSALGALFAGSPDRPVFALTPAMDVIASGVIGADGLYATSIATPPAGVPFYLQALVIDDAGRWHASSCITLLPDASVAADFVDGTGGLDSTTTLYSSTDVDWADLDKDGCQDVLVASDGADARPVILMGNCGASFIDGTSSILPAIARRPTSCIEVGDVNNDSWPDLFLGGGEDASSPAPNLLLLNDGTGKFRVPRLPTLGSSVAIGGATKGGAVEFGLPGGRGRAVDAEFGDVDGDADLDLIVTNIPDSDHPSEASDPVMLYVNLGGAQGKRLGTFAASPDFGELDGNQPHAANGDSSLADVDADGDLDVFVCANFIQNRLYVNDGTGSFTNVTTTALPMEMANAFEADFGDFDGDGDLDVLVANSISSDTTAVHFYENQTTTPDSPVFVDGSSRLPATFGPTTKVRLALDVGDVDNDGDLDAFVGMHELPSGAGMTDGEAVLLLNQGGLQAGTQGTFLVDAGFVPGLFVSADIALGDADHDGDLDVYLANSGNLFQTDFHDELWLNQP